MKYNRSELLLIIVCTLMIFCSVGMATATFSIYLPYFIKFHGFSNTQTSFLVSLRTISSFLCMFAVTKYFRVFSLRLGMSLAMVGCAMSFLIMGFFSNYYLNCLAVAMMGSTYTFASMYPLTIIMTRWFGDKSGVPLSISSSGSGVAAIFMPTLVTYIIDNFSLTAAFLMDAILSLISAILIYLVVRDNPSTGNEKSMACKTKKQEVHSFKEIPPKHFLLFMLAVTFNGSLTLAGWGHFAVLFKTSGYESMQVAFALSLGGIMLTLSKFFYGFITDKIHTFKSNFLFCSFINLGFLMSVLLPLGYAWVPNIMSILVCLGCPICTIGIAIWAKEISSPQSFPENLRKLQTCHQLGGLIFASIPGILADITGSYIPSYMIFFVLGMISFVIIQGIYIKNRIFDIYEH